MSQVQLLVHQIKSRLKSSGMTYAMLADRIGVSEPTLKRWFSKNTFSIQQLEDICAALSIHFIDIFQSPAIQDRNFLTAEQELELSSDELFFQAFYLVISGAKPEKIAQYLQLQPKQVSKFLYRMDLLGLIELHPNEKVIPLVQLSVRWQPQGLLQQKYGQMIRHDFMNSRFDGENEHDWFTTGKISAASLEMFTRKMTALVTEFDQLMKLEQNLPMSQGAHITFFAGYRSWQIPVLRKP